MAAMTSPSLRLCYRPIRVGFCVPEGNLRAFREVARLNATLWGGRFNPIIPVGARANERFADSLVRAFRPDLLLPVRPTKRLAQFIGGYPHLSGPFSLKELYTVHDGRHTAHFMTAIHPLRHIYEDHIRGRAEPEVVPYLFEVSKQDPLADVIRCVCGEYPAVSVTGTDYEWILTDELKAKREPIGLAEPLSTSLLEALTPLAITETRLEQDYTLPRRSSYGDSGVFVGSAGSFADLTMYWNLLACGYRVAFFDPAQATRCLPWCEDWLGHLREHKQTAPEWRQFPALWSADGHQAAPAELGTGFSRYHVAPRGFPRFSPTPLRWNSAEQAVLGASGTYGRNAVTVPLPGKPWFTDIRPSNEHAVATIRAYTLRSNEILVPPDIPELNDFYSREVHPGFHEVRVEPEGVSIIVDSWSTDVTMFLLEPTKLVERLFKQVGVTAVPSKAGRVVTRLIEEMGGLQGCRAFKIRGVRELVAKHGPLRSFTFGKARQILSQSWQDDYSTLYLEERETPQLRAEQAFAYLLGRKVFHPGVDVTCDRCQLTAWLSLDDARVEVTCPYCGSKFNCAPQLRDQDWKYRRSGLFGRDDNQEGGLAVALTLQQLDTALHQVKLWTAGFDLTWDEGQKACETDFVLLHGDHGEPNLVIGECKSAGGEISTKDVTNLKRIADRFKDLPVNVFIVFSKTGTFSEKEIARCRKANGKYSPRVILMAPRELEPYHLYDRVNKELGTSHHGIALAEMAVVTAQTYFK